MTKKDKVEMASRQLDRTLSFFPRIDTKVTALFAVGSAELAITFLNVTYRDFQNWFVAVPATAVVILLGLVFYWLYKCNYPHIEGGQGSLIYFREVAARTEAAYLNEFGALDEDSLFSDLAAQTWRNSQILSLKFDFLKRASIALAWSMLPFAGALIASSVLHSSIPRIGP
jgi:hypothetical protein